MIRIAALVMLVSCGSDAKHTADSPSNPTNPEPTKKSFSLFTDTKADLPTCSSDNQNQLVYVGEDTKFYRCKETEWGEVAIGPSPTKIVASILCGGSISEANAFITYSVRQFSSGDVFASVTVADNLLATTGVSFYSSQQEGSDTASVSIGNDFSAPSNGGWWKVSLDRKTLISTVEYNDSDISGGKKTWTMDPDKCVKNTYE